MIAIGERPLALDDVRAALSGPVKVKLTDKARAQIARSAETVAKLLATGRCDLWRQHRFRQIRQDAHRGEGSERIANQHRALACGGRGRAT